MAGWRSEVFLSAEQVPPELARLIGHHPAALRTVRWSPEPLAPDALAHLELETKHGLVTVIDHRSGAVYARPPAPPGIQSPRQHRDLSAVLPMAFSDRPVIEAIEPLTRAGALRGWRFRLSTGRAFSLFLDDRVPLLSADDPERGPA